MTQWLSAQVTVAILGTGIVILKSALIVGAVWCCTRVLRLTASMSASIWLALLFFCALFPLVADQQWIPVVEVTPPEWVGESLGGAMGVSLTSGPYDRPSIALLVIWLVGVAFFAGRVLRDLVAVQRLMSRATEALGSPMSLLSADVSLPAVGGLWRPVVLVPQAFHAWEPSHRAAVLTHELEHVRRRDPLLLAMSRLVCAVVWFNPVVWVLQRRFRIDMELACDEAVVRAGHDPISYARQLVDLASTTSSPSPVPAPGFWTPGSVLSRRVSAIIAPTPRRRAPSWFAILVVLAATAQAVRLTSVTPSSNRLSFLPVKNGTLVVKGRDRNLVLDMWPVSITALPDGRRKLELHTISTIRRREAEQAGTSAR